MMTRDEFEKLMEHLAEQRLDLGSDFRRHIEFRDFYSLIKEMAPGYIVHSR